MSESPRQRIPSYLGVMGTYGAAVVSAVLVGRAEGLRLDHPYATQDLVLGALATHKFTRLVAKDGVTTPLRAPFTEFEGEAGAAEVNERPRDATHPQHTVGELLVCPFCLAPWVAGAYVAALHLAPGVARAWAATFSLVGASDWLQQGYGRIRNE
ncbi:MAG: DUF1360 domain-containing protein [Marmoricola sp.]